MLELGVDFSEGADLRQSTIDCWKANGITFAIVQYSGKLPAYLAALDGQGLDLDVYVYLYFPRSPWGQTPEERVEAALRMCQGHGVRRMWLDVEEPTDPVDPASQQATVAALLRCVDLVKANGQIVSFGPGIYSGFWTYQQHTGNSAAFADLPLWHADYLAESPTPDLGQAPGELLLRNGPYGGWTKPTVWQWHNTTMFCGHSVDLNVRQAEEENDMMIPHNAVAEWFENRDIDPGVYTMQARSDLQLPPAARMVRLDLYLGGGGPLTFRHLSGLVAGVLEYGERHAIIDVEIGLDGTCGFDVAHRVTVRRIGALGFWL